MISMIVSGPEDDNRGDYLVDELIPTAAKSARSIGMKRQRIVDGACRVFFEKGYHPTTVRDIAEACNMSMGQLYHYISCKDDVLYLVHKHMQNLWYEYLKDSSYEKAKDPVKKLFLALRQTLRFSAENRRLIQFVYSESKYLDKRHLRAVLKIDKENVVDFWRKLLEAAKGNRLNRTDLGIAASVIAYLNVFLPLRGWTVKEKPTKRTTAFLMEFISRGMGLK